MGQEILRAIACMKGVQELDLRGCQWLTEKGLCTLLGTGADKPSAVPAACMPALSRLICRPGAATDTARRFVDGCRPGMKLIDT